MTYPDYSAKDIASGEASNSVLNSVRATNLVPDYTSTADLQVVVLDSIRQELQEIRRTLRGIKDKK